MSASEDGKVPKRWDWLQVQEWKNHNNYELGASNHRVVTRSQVPFCVIDPSLANLEVFADPKRHQPPGLPPLLVTMKRGYGSFPNTIITRSLGEFLDTDQKLCNELATYRKIKPTGKQGKGSKKGKGPKKTKTQKKKV